QSGVLAHVAVPDAPLPLGFRVEPDQPARPALEYLDEVEPRRVEVVAPIPEDDHRRASGHRAQMLLAENVQAEAEIRAIGPVGQHAPDDVKGSIGLPVADQL